MRATHTRCDRPRLIEDAWGDILVTAAEKSALHRRIMDGADARARPRLAALESEQAVIDLGLRRHPTYPGVITRSRYAEDGLAGAVARGVRQYVLIGAGLDSFVVRQPAFARAIDIFEIDHPASQAMKRDRLAAHAVVPANVHFIPADLAREALASALARSPFSPAVPTFFSWLGVSVYLSRAANLATLQGVASTAAPGSEMVFTYVDQRLLEARSSPRFETLRAGPAALGEPWLSGFDPTTLAHEVASLGLVLLEDLNGREMGARYAATCPGLAPGPAGHAAHVRVAER